MEITTDRIARIIGGEWIEKPDKAISHKKVGGISIDSRTLCQGDLFWCIKGERFDGHNFVEEAFKKGALAAVVSRPMDSCSAPGRLISVQDTLKALQILAKSWREMHPCPIVAVTGSSGKTTTKELIAKILKQRYNCLSTEGNMNNHIGVPLMLLRLEASHEVGVLELGMNHLGEIAQLTDMVKPKIGVITNIGKAHIGLLGSVNQIIDAKSELLEGMGPDSLAVLNRDDPYYYILAERCQNGVITVGESEKADLRIQKIELLPSEGKTQVVMKIKEKILSLSLPILGRFIAYNLLMAIAVAMEMGCEQTDIESGIADFSPIPNRMDHQIIKGIHILNDSYNANPESMHSALSTLFECKGSARSMAILGDMLELGSQSECLHRQLGQWLGHNKRVDFLIAYGVQAELMAQEAVKTGYPPQNVWSINNLDEIAKMAGSLLDAGDWVLIKGSRQMGLDRVASDLSELIRIRNGFKKKQWDKEERDQCSII
ncbi:MAG: UDP-N-acetylmuramoyl-tripeptide--D-alanyl-D-alanine ligase [bacterium]